MATAQSQDSGTIQLALEYAGKAASVAGVACLYLLALSYVGEHPPTLPPHRVAVGFVVGVPAYAAGGYLLATAVSRLTGRDVPRRMAAYVAVGGAAYFAGAWLLVIRLGVV
jgi:hypothetical protein